MNIAVLNKTGSQRSARRFDAGFGKEARGGKDSISIESGAGLGAARTDDDYTEAGATVVTDRNALLANADLLVVVNRPSEDTFQTLKTGAVVLGFLRPLDEPAELTPSEGKGAHDFFDGAGAADNARAGDGCLVVDGHGRRLQSSGAGRGSHPRRVLCS